LAIVLSKHMQRYMVHLQNRSHTAKEATILLQKARELVEPEVTVRDARVSKKYIELDISMPDSMDIIGLASKLRAMAPLASYEHIVEHHLGKDEAMKRARELFNDEKYWGAHEALEYVWKGSSGAEKSILNGIILVAAAFVHHEKDEPEICLSILQRAKKKLDGTGGMYHGIDVDRIAHLIAKIISSGRIERFTI
jgi:hypothetical protein